MGRNKNYTEEFKKQIVALRNNGKTVMEIAREYNVVLCQYIGHKKSNFFMLHF